MNLTTNADYFLGKKSEQKEISISDMFKNVKEVADKTKEWPVDRIIDVFNEFSCKILDKNNILHRLYPNSGLAFIANWCRRANLEALLDTSLGDRYCLDKFVESKKRISRAYKAFPVGVVVHWLAGNVPTLGFLSLLQGVLTKNANIIKLPSGSNNMLTGLLEQISEINIKNYSASELVKSIAIIRHDHSLKNISDAISLNANARVIWGNDNSVSAVKALPTKLNVNDIVFSNKTSLIVIGRDILENVDISELAGKIATDISVFEQKACASPHTIFLETEDDTILVKLAESLKKSILSLLGTMPKTVPSQMEVTVLLNLRAKYDMFHRAWYSDGMEFTILSDDYFKLGPPIGNRTIYLRKVEELDSITNLITPKVQSIGIVAMREQYEKLTKLFGEKGVQRFTQVGTMTFFEVPWDGYFLPQHLVRWTSRFNY